MLKKWAILLLTTALMFTACRSPVYNQTQGNVADAVMKTRAARAKSDNDARPAPPLLMKQGPYVDTTPISLERDPSWLHNHIVIRGEQLPFSYYSRTIGNGATTNVLTKYQTGLDPAINVSMNYTGTVKGALDLLASKSGYVYSIHGSSIYWQAFVTRTFDIAFMPGGTDYLMGKTNSQSSGANANANQSSSGGTVQNYVSSDSSDSEYSNLKGTLSIWKDLDNTIKQMLSPDGKVMVSESTTTVTVRDKPTNVQLVAQYISNLNNRLSKQVLVKVEVLEINLSNDYEFGVNWQVIGNAFAHSAYVLNGNYGTPVTITALSQQSGILGAPAAATPQFGTVATSTKIPSYTILFNALTQQGKTSVVSQPRVVCLNNQVSVIRIVRSQGYLASVQNTSLAGGSGTNVNASSTVTSQLTPGTVITGLTLYILPKILNDKVYLQVNADLSTLQALTTISNTGTTPSASTTSIQVPNIFEKHFNQRSMIRSGDTLILSGFRQVSNVANANQFLSSQALGGRGSTQNNSETIVLITPILLDKIDGSA